MSLVCVSMHKIFYLGVIKFIDRNTLLDGKAKAKNLLSAEMREMCTFQCVHLDSKNPYHVWSLSGSKILQQWKCFRANCCHAIITLLHVSDKSCLKLFYHMLRRRHLQPVKGCQRLRREFSKNFILIQLQNFLT